MIDMRKKVVGTILIGMLIMSACSFSNSNKNEKKTRGLSQTKYQIKKLLLTAQAKKLLMIRIL